MSWPTSSAWPIGSRSSPGPDRGGGHARRAVAGARPRLRVRLERRPLTRPSRARQPRSAVRRAGLRSSDGRRPAATSSTGRRRTRPSSRASRPGAPSARSSDRRAADERGDARGALPRADRRGERALTGSDVADPADGERPLRPAGDARPARDGAPADRPARREPVRDRRRAARPARLLLGRPGRCTPSTAGRSTSCCPGILALAIVSTSLVNLAISTAFERSYGVLKRLGGSPLPRSGLVAAKIGTVLRRRDRPGRPARRRRARAARLGAGAGWSPVVVLLAFALGTLAFAGLGLLLAGTLRAEATLAIANGLFLVFLLLGGVVLPVDHLPGSSWPTSPGSCRPAPCPTPPDRPAARRAGDPLPSLARARRLGRSSRPGSLGDAPLPLGLGRSEAKRGTPVVGPGVQGYANWLRGTDSNRRPSGYEPDELPLLHPATYNYSTGPSIGQPSDARLRLGPACAAAPGPRSIARIARRRSARAQTTSDDERHGDDREARTAAGGRSWPASRRLTDGDDEADRAGCAEQALGGRRPAGRAAAATTA